jgi:hypothetical protein
VSIDCEEVMTTVFGYCTIYATMPQPVLSVELRP